MKSLQNKNILLGVTGGIAAYKSAEIVRSLKKMNADVRVVMTKSSHEFVTPLTLQALSANPISSDLLDVNAEAAMSHIELARWADALLIAPCTAETISRLASGRGDDLLTTITLAFDGPIAIAPAMNQAMWRDSRTQDNVSKLVANNTLICGPGTGEQACGDVGIGRMLEPEEVLNIFSSLFKSGKLISKKVVVTAGPTQEPIDPVRYLTNRSSGKMGYALANAALEAGAEVVLISGPTDLNAPEHLHFVSVRTAKEMHEAVQHHLNSTDIFIGSAAVSDYKPSKEYKNKIKKDKGKKSISFELEENIDILKGVSSQTKRPFVVGFAAETQDVIKNAREKLVSKNLDLIIANDVSKTDIGFDSEENEVTLITSEDDYFISKDSKKAISKKIIDFISEVI